MLQDASCRVEKGEKVGLIGRNGEGKTSLFHILTGRDTHHQGEVTTGRGVTILATEQEHYSQIDKTVRQYILQALPQYVRLKHIIETYPDTMGGDVQKMTQYSEALEQFDSRGYFSIESVVEKTLSTFGLAASLDQPVATLSGGQKRLVEVAKVMVAQPDLCLLDEPTNHMDYYAKSQFIQWLAHTKSSVLVITHDRDVLDSVDRIIELKDKRLLSYKGSYQAYLKQNSATTTNQVSAYETTQRRIDNLKAKVIEYQRLKERARDPGTIQRFKRLERQSRDELSELEAQEKPTFWVDQQSAQNMKLVSAEQYSRHKAKNIRLQGVTGQEGHARQLVEVADIALGYDEVLLSGVSFQIHEGDVMELRGRNGAGKSTLIKALLAAAGVGQTDATLLEGEFHFASKLRIGVYEQEVPTEFLSQTLAHAIEGIYREHNTSITETKIRQLMSDYLFRQDDAEIPVAQLSGGQKARLQLIRMLANEPSLLVLDEPTNHLDLPSIEELEQALRSFKGAILYVSHDTYFRTSLGGQVLQLGAT